MSDCSFTLQLNCIMKAKVDKFITQDLQPNAYSMTVFNIPIGMHLFINMCTYCIIYSVELVPYN